MNNNIIVFENEEFGNVRTIMIDNEPWFVASDVCRALDVGNTSQALTRIDADEKDIILNDTLGGKQETLVINEYGLYSLILSSRKPEAKKFKRWITHEVIPAIRKTGSYSIHGDNKNVAVSSEDISGLVQITNKLIDQNQELMSIIKNHIVKNETVVDDPSCVNKNHATSYNDIIEASEYPVSITIIANDYGISARKLNKILAIVGVQSKDNGHWNLNDEYDNNDYTTTLIYMNKQGVYAPNIKWTKNGRRFIYDILKNQNLIPICER